MNTRPLVFAALAFAFAAQAQQPPPQQSPRPPQSKGPQAPTAPMASFGWFAELAGSCWKGSRAEGRSDVQCYQKQFNRFIRGSIKFYQNDKLTAEADSVFGYDGNARLIIYSQWASNGSVGFGQATLVNGDLIFQNHTPDNAESPTRSVWRKVDADSFKVSRQRRSEQGAWTEESAVAYTRVQREPSKGG
jgi:hypothetical protein